MDKLDTKQCQTCNANLLLIYLSPASQIVAQHQSVVYDDTLCTALLACIKTSIYTLGSGVDNECVSVEQRGRGRAFQIY